MLDKAQRISARWEEICPKVPWGRSVKAQREALIHLLADDELPERILVGISGAFNPRTAIIVATNRQVLCVEAKRNQRIPYSDVLLVINEPLPSCIRIKSVDGTTLDFSGPNKAAVGKLTNFIKAIVREQVQLTDEHMDETISQITNTQRDR